MFVRSLILFALKVIGESVGLITLWYIATRFELEESGYFVSALSSLFLLGGIATLGFSVAFSRFVPIYLNGKKRGAVHGLYKYVLRWTSSAMLACAGIFLLQVLSWDEVRLSRVDVAILTLAVPLWALMVLHREFLRAANETLRADLGFQIIRPLGCLVCLAVMPYWFSAPVTIVWAFALPLLLVLLHDISLLNVYISSEDSIASDSEQWRAASRYFSLQTFSRLAIERLDVLVVANMLGLETASLYGVASRVAMLSSALVDPVSSVLRPRASLKAGLGDKKGLQLDLFRATMWITLPCLVVSSVLIAAPQLWLGAFGEEFRTASNILILLVVGRVFASYGATPFTVLLMSGAERCCALGSGIINLLLYPLLLIGLTVTFGAIGAAVATAIAWMLSTIVMQALVHSQLGLRALPLPTLKNLRLALSRPSTLP